METLRSELARIAAAARLHGMTVIDLATIERLLDAPRPGERRDLMVVYPLVE